MYSLINEQQQDKDDSRALKNATYHYSTEYKLDKAHFNECYEQSVTQVKGIKKYTKPFVFLLLSICLFFSPFTDYLTYFFIGLTLIEVLSIHFKQNWWVMRQMVGKAANHIISLNIDNNGISIESDFVNQHILWSDVSDVQITEKGLLIIHNNIKSYISQNCLTVDALQFIANHRINVD